MIEQDNRILKGTKRNLISEDMRSVLGKMRIKNTVQDFCCHEEVKDREPVSERLL